MNMVGSFQNLEMGLGCEECLTSNSTNPCRSKRPFDVQ
jgi:hypothetical protein